MAEDEDDGKRPEMAEAFYWEDPGTGRRELVRCDCGGKAIVRDEDAFYCNRCWEFFPDDPPKRKGS